VGFEAGAPVGWPLGGGDCGDPLDAGGGAEELGEWGATAVELGELEALAACGWIAALRLRLGVCALV
jgi:hypothetical protein